MLVRFFFGSSKVYLSAYSFRIHTPVQAMIRVADEISASTNDPPGQSRIRVTPLELAVYALLEGQEPRHPKSCSPGHSPRLAL